MMRPDTPEGQARGLTQEELLTLAHELRGALTVISGYSDILRRPLDAAAHQTATEGIARAIQRADRLLQDALAGSASASMRLERLDIAILTESIAAEQRITTGRPIHVRIEGAPVANGDENALSRLLGNLVDNAAKYSPEGSTIDIEVRAIDGVVQVTVLDRGPGIAEEYRAAAFNPMERLGVGDAIGGTGIGLAVVAQIAAAHGGEVMIADRPGGGAAITLELPRSS